MRRVPWAGPELSASQLGASSAASSGGEARSAGGALRAVGVNVDLAPVADVPAAGSFLAGQGRTFGTSTDVVAGAVSAFALGLRDAGFSGGREALPGHRPGDAEHRPVRRGDPVEPRGSGGGPRPLPGGDRRRRADRDGLERLVHGARLEARAVVAADPAAAARRPRIPGRDTSPMPWRAPPPRAGAGCRRSRCSPAQAGVDLLLLTGSESRARPCTSAFSPPRREGTSRPRRSAAATTGSSI